MRWGLATKWQASATNAIFLPEARGKPVLIKSRISHTESAAAIDRQVREFLGRGESLYSVDIDILRDIEPDIIVTQDLCHVCAATPDDLGAALSHLQRQPRIVTLNPHSLADVCADIRTVGEATGRAEQADALVAEFERDVANVEQICRGACSGLGFCAWNGSIRRMLRDIGFRRWCSARGSRCSGASREAIVSRGLGKSAWTQPEVIVIMPCGYSLAAAETEFRNLPLPQGWEGYAGGAEWARFCG